MNAQVIGLLREAAEWRLIALLFEPPSDSWRRQIEQLAAEVSDPVLREAALAAKREASSTMYHTTFGPGGPAAPREVSYCGMMLPGQLMGEVTAYYRAFAYDPALCEAPDHVAVESGFVAYLRLKEAYAQERGDLEQAGVCAEAAQRFVADHLSTMAEPLASALKVSGIPYLAAASEALSHRAGPRKPAASIADSRETGCPVEGGCVFSED